MLDHWGGILTDIHGRIKTMDDLPRRQSCVQQNRNGTAYLHHLCRNAEQEASGVQRTPAGGVSIDEWVIAARTLCMAVRPYDGTRLYTLPLNIILYMIASIAGVVLVHIALDNISKFIKEGLIEDRSLRE